MILSHSTDSAPDKQLADPTKVLKQNNVVMRKYLKNSETNGASLEIIYLEVRYDRPSYE